MVFFNQINIFEKEYKKSVYQHVRIILIGFKIKILLKNKNKHFFKILFLTFNYNSNKMHAISFNCKKHSDQKGLIKFD